MSDYLDPNNEELLKDFFVEAQMQVELLESNILVLENDPSNSDAVDEIFRAAHTLKGASATVQMTELTTFTHLVEDVLDEIRGGQVKVNEDVVDTLLNAIDIIKDMLSARTSGSVYEGDVTNIQSRLHALLEKAGSKKRGNKGSAQKGSTSSKLDKRKAQGAPAAAGAEEQNDAQAYAGISEPGTMSEYELLELREAAGRNVPISRVRVHFDETNPMNTVGGIQVFAALKSVGNVLKTVPEFEELYEDNFFPVVDYYLASDADETRLRESVTLPDVTTAVEITTVGEEVSAATSEREGLRQPLEEARRAEPATSARGAEGEEAGVQSQPEMQKREAEVRRSVPSSSVLRVDSRRIDDLLNLVSETVINKATFNQISSAFGESVASFQAGETRSRELLRELFDMLPEYAQAIADGAAPKTVRKELLSRFGVLFTLFDEFESLLKSSVNKFRSTAQNLGRITGELQEGVMRIRMVPISQIFSRFPRLVRDLSKSLGKKVQLEIEGEDTELDKSVIEDLLDPLIHCVRNSIDHGIEAPEKRREVKKPEEGTLSLRASNEGNMIIIEVADDGCGIDVDSVRKKAIDKGLIHPSKTLSDVEAFNLIFDAGFSTASRVTDVSGRGVGLDVVRRQIEKLNGNVTVWSEQGAGTRFTIKIPLTLAIIQGLLVRVGQEQYAIPITSVIESHRIKPVDIKMIDNYEVFNVRDDVISLLRLNRLFMIPAEENKEYYFVVIVGTGDKKVGLVVDSLIGEEDVVIKPLRDHYTNAPGIAGANITGNGTVSLIIDVSQLLELGLKHEMEQRRKRETVIG